MAVVVKDWRGTKISIGSIVVYPSRQSSSLWMNEGEVVMIEDRSQYAKGGEVVIGVRRSKTSRSHDKTTGRISFPGVNRITVIS